MYGKIRERHWSGARALRYEDLLRTIVHFAAQGDLQLNGQTGISEMDQCKSAQMGCMIAQSEIYIIEDWYLNAKERRSSTLNSSLVRLRAELFKKAEELDSQKRTQLEALLSQTEFHSSLTDVQRQLVLAIFAQSDFDPTSLISEQTMN